MMGLAAYAAGVKGKAALEMSRLLNVDHKSAFIFEHKIREALLAKRDITPLQGIVHVDGMYVNGKIRPKNAKHRRIDRRLKRHQKPSKRVIISLCMKLPDSLSGYGIPTAGTYRTITAVVKSENTDDLMSIVCAYVAPGSTIYADENNAYDALAAKYKMGRVNHQEEWVTPNGINNNYAESYNGWLRRAQYGVYHKFGELYLQEYANEAAYRQDMRRRSQGDIIDDIFMRCLTSPQSRHLSKYWQGNRRRQELLGPLGKGPTVATQ